MALQAVAAFEQHHPPPREIGALYAGRVRKRMGARAGEHVAVLEQIGPGKIPDGCRGCAKPVRARIRWAAQIAGFPL
jgi:hypothetical protein